MHIARNESCVLKTVEIRFVLPNLQRAKVSLCFIVLAFVLDVVEQLVLLRFSRSGPRSSVHLVLSTAVHTTHHFSALVRLVRDEPPRVCDLASSANILHYLAWIFDNNHVRLSKCI